MHTMHTPLGKLTAHSIPQDTQSILLAGEYHGYPFHIYATQPSNPSQLDYPFYTQILNNLPHFIAQAEQQLHTSQRQPESHPTPFSGCLIKQIPLLLQTQHLHIARPMRKRNVQRLPLLQRIRITHHLPPRVLHNRKAPLQHRVRRHRCQHIRLLRHPRRGSLKTRLPRKR